MPFIDKLDDEFLEYLEDLETVECKWLKVGNEYKLYVRDKDPDELYSRFLREYEPVSILGQGTYGCVFEAKEIRGKEGGRTRTYPMAVKRIPVKSVCDIKTPAEHPEMMYTFAFNQALKGNFMHPGVLIYFYAWYEQPPYGWQRRIDTKLMKKMKLEPSCSSMLFNYRDDSEFVYIAMELCKSNLADWLKANTSRDLDRMKSWIRQIASAVAYLHRYGVIHRDLKPGNIFFAGDDHLKVGDLGSTGNLTKIRDQSAHIADDRTFGVGTEMYMAPEQPGWVDYSSKVDVFALGLIFTELCVCMPSDVKETVFDNYRAGRPNSILDHLPEEKAFVYWLTIVDQNSRPSSAEVLQHPVLAQAEKEIMAQSSG